MTVKEFSKIVEQKRIENGMEDDIFPPPTTDREAVMILRHHFLGDNWYVVNPISHEQVNTEAIWDILSRYPHAEQEKEKFYKKVENVFISIKALFTKD